MAKWMYIVLRVLLGNGADANAKHVNNWKTALHHAAEPSRRGSDKGNAVRVLLEAGADIEAKTKDCSSTPVHLSACSRSSTSGAILALLEGGADVNAEEVDRCPPLHLACAKSSVPAVELLLRWGANEKLVDSLGQTAADTLGS
ncbi:unnamed protein product [Ectocarpus sp. CCAP 1310/34]|nr:unnamed protein product [Ectocarpus sp. CCAP 1310/34]